MADDSIDYDFISQLEGGRKTQGYVPADSSSSSGVTVATGFDLGCRSEADLKNLGLGTELIAKLRPYLGKKKQEATALVSKNPLTIDDDEAQAIDKAVRGKESLAMQRKYKLATKSDFNALDAEAQTVIASVSFQYGDLATKTPKFWNAVVGQDWKEVVKILRNFGDLYRTRRLREADLLGKLAK